MKMEISTSGKKEKKPFVSREPELREDFTETVLGLNLDMIYVEGGEFEMGAPEEQEDVYDREKPVHNVTLDGFHIGKYPVTQAQWKAVMGTTIEQQRDKAAEYWAEDPLNLDLFGVGDVRPMHFVSWEEAQEFCRKLSEATGRKYMLPTEAQWEYAARGGKESRHYAYAGSNDIDEVAWYNELYPGHGTHSVGRKRANELGIYDMNGNVWEWCLDWWEDDYDENDYDENDYDENDTDDLDWRDDFFVIRGGGWNTDAVNCRVSDWCTVHPSIRNNNLGFRVACCLKEYGEDFTEIALGLDMEMVHVECGESWLGATMEQGDAFYSFGRIRKIKLDEYHIGRYPVTQVQWRMVMGTEPSWFAGNNRPVECVSWYDAQEFCRRLSEVTGRKYMLPTEAQWEYAARGGKESQHYKYAGSNDVDEVAWYWENSDDFDSEQLDYAVQPVGMKKANELGIYDMNGNVWEWCSDWLGRYDENDTENPRGPISGERRVIRGGSMDGNDDSCRVSFRHSDYPGSHSPYLGFRVVCIL